MSYPVSKIKPDPVDTEVDSVYIIQETNLNKERVNQPSKHPGQRINPTPGCRSCAVTTGEVCQQTR
jgi:hypothetical protein